MVLDSRLGFSHHQELDLAGDDLIDRVPEPKGTTAMDQETEDAVQGQVEVEAHKERDEPKLQIQRLKQVNKHQEDL